MNEENQVIDIRGFLKYVMRHWWIMLAIAVFTSGVTYYITSEKIAPTYLASTTLFVGKDDSGNLEDISLMDIQVGYQLVLDYQELLSTNLVTKRVISDLALTMKPSDIRNNISVAIIKDSRFMHVFYKDTNPARAAAIVNDLSNILAEKAVEIVGARNVHIVDYAMPPESPEGPNTVLNTLIAAIMGAVLGLCIIILKIILINTVQKEEEIERDYGLPVLGSIPSFKGGTRI